MDIMLVLGGILVLYLGAEVLVKGAAQLALSLGVSSLIVGLTIVSFSTSMPEVVASVIAQWKGGNGQIALGNVVGSNIANVGLILGLVAWIHPLSYQSQVMARETQILLGSAILLVLIMILDQGIYLGGATALLIAFVLFVWYQIMMAKAHRKAFMDREELTEVAHLPKRGRLPAIGWDLALIAVGLALLVIGGWLLIEGATSLARLIGVSEWVIGLTVVAFGTSCPELATSLVAAWRKEHDLSLGNIVGSNVFNTLFIGGIAASVRPISVTVRDAAVDLGVMSLFSVALYLVVKRGSRMGRLQGATFCLGYVAYIFFLFLDH